MKKYLISGIRRDDVEKRMNDAIKRGDTALSPIQVSNREFRNFDRDYTATSGMKKRQKDFRFSNHVNSTKYYVIMQLREVETA